MKQEFSKLVKDTLAFLQGLEDYEEFSPFFVKKQIQKSLFQLPQKTLKKISLPTPPRTLPAPIAKKEVVEKIKPVPEIIEEKKPFFKLEPLGAPPVLLFDELRNLLKKVAPRLNTLDTLPDDRSAKQIKQAWQEKNHIPSVAVFLFHEKEKERLFLKNLASAIDTLRSSSKPVDALHFEREKNWDFFFSSKQLKLIVLLESSLHSSLDLMRYYKEYPTSRKKTLGEIPLFLLPDLSLYFKDPLLKSSLWNALCSQLSS